MPGTYISPAESGLYYLQSRYYDPQVKRFVNADSHDVVTATPASLNDKNLFAYCDNNPVSRVDVGGAFWDTVLDVVSLGFSIKDVIDNPKDVGAWVGLVGDAVDVLVPCIGGIGEITRTVNTSRKVTKAAKTTDPLKDALKQLDASGLRPGQTQISRSRVMELVNDFDPIKATSCVYSNGKTRYLVDGHHTTVASTILGKGTCMNMGAVTNQLPSATNVYWSKKWYEFGKKVIKIVD